MNVSNNYCLHRFRNDGRWSLCSDKEYTRKEFSVKEINKIIEALESRKYSTFICCICELLSVHNYGDKVQELADFGYLNGWLHEEWDRTGPFIFTIPGYGEVSMITSRTLLLEAYKQHLLERDSQ